MHSEETINFHFLLWLSGVKDDSSCVALKKYPLNSLKTCLAQLMLIWLSSFLFCVFIGISDVYL